MDFQFQQFRIQQDLSPMKIGTDSLLLGAWTDAGNCHDALDVGTGTGILSLMLAQRYSELRITGIEPHQKAFQEATVNFRNSPWSNRLISENTTLQDFSVCRKFDLILSNPPYYTENIPSPERGRSQARQAVHLPAEELISCSAQLLAPRGRFILILPEANSISFIVAAAKKGLYVRRQCLIHPDTNMNPNRRMMEFRRKRGVVRQEYIFIRKDGKWSDEYRKLTENYLLRLR